MAVTPASPTQRLQIPNPPSPPHPLYPTPQQSHGPRLPFRVLVVGYRTLKTGRRRTGIGLFGNWWRGWHCKNTLPRDMGTLHRSIMQGLRIMDITHLRWHTPDITRTCPRHIMQSMGIRRRRCPRYNHHSHRSSSRMRSKMITLGKRRRRRRGLTGSESGKGRVQETAGHQLCRVGMLAHHLEKHHLPHRNHS